MICCRVFSGECWGSRQQRQKRGEETDEGPSSGLRLASARTFIRLYKTFPEHLLCLNAVQGAGNSEVSKMLSVLSKISWMNATNKGTKQTKQNSTVA